MGDFGKDLAGIVSLLIGVALVALLVGHAAATGSLLVAGGNTLNTLLNTVELSSTASDTPYSGSSALGGLSNTLSSTGFGI